MDKQTLYRQIQAMQFEVDKLGAALRALGATDIAQFPDNYEQLSLDAALRSESITCKLRHLVYSTTKVPKPVYLEQAGAMQGIEISYSDDILEITLPCLLPKRKQRAHSEFLSDSLFFTLSDFALSNRLPRFEHCVVCFSQIYGKSRNPRWVRDCDNLEWKQLLDVIATFVMVDDNGLLCDAYNTAEIGETCYSRITVMHKDRFTEWLEERKNRLKSISNF